MRLLNTSAHTMYKLLLQPRSSGADNRRREFILNVLLAGLLSIALLALLASMAVLVIHQNFNGSQSIIVTAVFCLFVGLLRWAVWHGWARTVSLLLISLLLASSTQLMLHWSYVLPQALLDYTMVIVIAGILLGARIGLLAAAVAVLLLITIALAETHGYVQIDTSWRHQPPIFIDALGSGLIFSIIGLVSWLSNREIDQSLQRARSSEADLLEERNTLEAKVIERTRELEQIQLLRITELERFAALGKISAAFVHEVSNPLMAASLHLRQVKSTDQASLDPINQSLQQIERHLAAARRQMRGDITLKHFLVAAELNTIAESMRPAAGRNHIKLKLPQTGRLKIYGDAVKFSQIVTNLLMNAIESYPAGEPRTERLVVVSLVAQKHSLKLTVCDNGSGIDAADLGRIFEPFYSRKPVPERHTGMGIGLTIVKQFVEQDFGGKLRVSSSREVGTCFTAVLRPAQPEVR